LNGQQLSDLRLKQRFRELQDRLRVQPAAASMTKIWFGNRANAKRKGEGRSLREGFPQGRHFIRSTVYFQLDKYFIGGRGQASEKKYRLCSLRPSAGNSPDCIVRQGGEMNGNLRGENLLGLSFHGGVGRGCFVEPPLHHAFGLGSI
jgi:hypothetical protein